jgi:SPP1 gp7 family putative phage head morphogenesis protein
MLHVNIAQLVRPGFVAPGHRSERFRARSPRKLRPVMPSKADELYYRAELHEIVRELRTWARQHLIPALRGHFPGKFTYDAKLEPPVEVVIVEKQREFAKVGPKSQDLAARVVLKNVRTVDERLAASIRASMDINIEPFLTDTGRIREMMGEKVIKNVELIQSIPSQYFQEVSNTVAENWQTGTNYETLTEAIEKVGDVTDTRAALIARDQTGKLSSAFNEVRQTDLGIEFYGWVCTHMRTRPAHLAMETKDVGNGPGVFSWKKPGPLIGAYGVHCHPGADINCRCGAIPHVNLADLVNSMGYGAN